MSADRAAPTAQNDHMDPELEAFAVLFPDADLSDPVAARTKFAGLAASIPAPDTSAMKVEDHVVPADPDVRVRIYRPHFAQGALIWLHGGGFVMGNLDTEHPWAARLADGSGVVVISVEYRLAPENPFPAAVDDAYAVLTWAAENADDLGIDRDRIAVGGHSAGAGIAAGVALLARNEGGPPIRFQLLNQPALDDRRLTWSSRNLTDIPWMNSTKTAQLWRHYLGPLADPVPASIPVSPYAAPARAVDLAGLPPAYIGTAEYCTNRDEDIEYALRLLQAGVSVELHQWPGTFHGSQAILSAEISQRQIAELCAAVRRAVADQ